MSVAALAVMVIDVSPSAVGSDAKLIGSGVGGVTSLPATALDTADQSPSLPSASRILN
ncbi:hypothetical protein Hhel01_04304 [Haloferula helveola]